MKKIFQRVLTAFMMVTLFASMAVAQTDVTEATVKTRFKQKLTEEQKAILDANRTAAKERHDVFKATLTEDQKAILANKELDPKARKDAFMASLTDAQKEMLAANKEAAEEAMKTFRATLTDRQKAVMKARGQKLKRKLVKG